MDKILILLTAILIIQIIREVHMEQAIANVRQALVDLNAKIATLQPQTITEADVQAVADGGYSYGNQRDRNFYHLCLSLPCLVYQCHLKYCPRIK